MIDNMNIADIEEASYNRGRLEREVVALRSRVLIQGFVVVGLTKDMDYAAAVISDLQGTIIPELEKRISSLVLRLESIETSVYHLED